jgi:hypothetical protein
MNTDLIMLVIGMSMALLVSFLGMMLAYTTYQKNKKQTVNPEETKEKGGA